MGEIVWAADGCVHQVLEPGSGQLRKRAFEGSSLARTSHCNTDIRPGDTMKAGGATTLSGPDATYLRDLSSRLIQASRADIAVLMSGVEG